MIDRPLETIGRADLEALVTNKTHEGRSLDYKRELPGAKDEDRREFARDVSSFANAAGGDIIYGVEEAKDAEGRPAGYPKKIVGVEGLNFDALKLRLANMVRDNVAPRVQGITFHMLAGFDRGPVVIVRIPKSWLAPHMVAFQNQTHFYSRNAAGKQPLDVREIRAAFAASADAAERAKRFRDERIARIIAGETPVMMRTDQGDRRIVLHTMPLGADVAIDVREAYRQRGSLPPAAPTGWNHSFNLDGFVTYCGNEHGQQRTYLQVFRDGNLEGVVLPHADANEHELFAFPFEVTVVEALQVHLRAARLLGVDSPLAMSVTLLGMASYRLYVSRDRPAQNAMRDNVVILPSIIVEGSPEIEPLLRTTFDALWQASGFERSLGYDEVGNWVKHPK